MESIIKKLGKTSVTVEKDYHSPKKEYNKLTIVEEEGAFKTYLSRKPVPIDVELTNREYWIPFSGVLESITFDYLKFKRDYASGNALENNSIITRHILDRNIERIKIALKAISEEEIDDDAVIERTIKDRNVTSNKIAKENILTEHFAKKSVITSILADYIITAIKLADNSVTTRSIANENITDIKLADNAVTTRSIAQESIIEEKFANNSVSTRSLIDESVTTEKLAKNSVTESKIADNNITNRKIANNAIDIIKFDSYTRNIIESVRYIPEEFASIKEAIFDEINKYKPIVINGNVTNAADEEDITSENNLLKLKDRTSINGMGYIILRKNKSFAEQVTKENTIYEIRYNFDLQTESINIPVNSFLNFNGGSIYNGNINFQNTKLLGSPIIKNCRFSGSISGKSHIKWFVNSEEDSTNALSDLLQCSNNIIIDEGIWYISKTCLIKSNTSVTGYGEMSKIIVNKEALNSNPNKIIVFSTFLGSVNLNSENSLIGTGEISNYNIHLSNIYFKIERQAFAEYDNNYIYTASFAAITDTENWSINNCHFVNTFINDTKNHKMVHCSYANFGHVSNCKCDSCNLIYFGNSHDVIINSNIIYKSPYTSIECVNTYNVEIDSNTLNGSNIAKDGGSTIGINMSTKCIVTNNNLYDTTFINFGHPNKPTSDSIISGNIIDSENNAILVFIQEGNNNLIEGNIIISRYSNSLTPSLDTNSILMVNNGTNNKVINNSIKKLNPSNGGCVRNVNNNILIFKNNEIVFNGGYGCNIHCTERLQFDNNYIKQLDLTTTINTITLDAPNVYIRYNSIIGKKFSIRGLNINICNNEFTLNDSAAIILSESEGTLEIVNNKIITTYSYFCLPMINISSIKRYIVSGNTCNTKLFNMIYDVNNLIKSFGDNETPKELPVVSTKFDNSLLKEGSVVWSHSYNKPIFYNGTKWVDATGADV